MSDPSDRLPRIAGWDLLRGLCALAVMTYHLLGWTGLAALSAFGTYGVYLFFVLSGASLGYAYPPQAVGSVRGMAVFLGTRWFRLAPLYLLACCIFLGLLAAHQGGWVDHLAWRLLLNATFAFGWDDPVLTAATVGGWSLGIEFVFYLLFPWLVRLEPGSVWAWLTLALLTTVQFAWVGGTVGQQGLARAAVDYHQVPAFAAYFYAGCLIGQARRAQRGLQAWPLWRGGPLACALLALALAGASGPVAGAELWGLWGWILPAACVAAVWVSGQVQVQGLVERVARILGDLTYGTYLLHPLVFFAAALVLFWPGLQDPAAPAAARAAAALGLAVLTLVAAAASARLVEIPARRLGRHLLRPRTTP